MRISLNVLLELNLPVAEKDHKRLRGIIINALKNNSNLITLAKEIRVGLPKSILTMREVKQAGGRALAASMSPRQRKAAAKRAAAARWNKIGNQQQEN